MFKHFKIQENLIDLVFISTRKPVLENTCYSRHPCILRNFMENDNVFCIELFSA